MHITIIHLVLLNAILDKYAVLTTHVVRVSYFKFLVLISLRIHNRINKYLKVFKYLYIFTWVHYLYRIGFQRKIYKKYFMLQIM